MSEWAARHGYTFTSKPQRTPGHCWNIGPYLYCYGHTGVTVYDTRKWN